MPAEELMDVKDVSFRDININIYIYIYIFLKSNYKTFALSFLNYSFSCYIYKIYIFSFLNYSFSSFIFINYSFSCSCVLYFYSPENFFLYLNLEISNIRCNSLLFMPYFSIYLLLRSLISYIVSLSFTW